MSMNNIFFDYRILSVFASISNSVLNYIFLFFTRLGNEFFYLILIPMVYWSVKKKKGVRFAIILFFTIYLNQFLKGIFNMPRPDISRLSGHAATFIHNAIKPQDNGFPSGHTQISFILWLELAGLFYNIYKKKFFYIIAIFVWLMIALSRLYFAVHFPGDVVGGFIFAFLTFFIFHLYWKFSDNGKIFNIAKFYTKLNPFIRIAILIIIFILPLSLVHNKGTITIAGAFTGFFCGNLIIKDETIIITIKLWIIKIVIGIISSLIIYSLLKFFFNIMHKPLWLSYFLRFIRYFLLSFWVVQYPYFWNKYLLVYQKEK